MRNDLVIKVDNLSKCYQIGVREKFPTLRDTLSNIISLKRRSNQRTNFWALKNISFRVKKGEVIGIIGPNGSGKSTLLKILSRITLPTRGKALVWGRVSSLLEVGTGFNQELTGRENIYLNGSILGMSRQDLKSKFRQIVDFSGIEKFLDTPVKRYSSGMYIRLAFAIAAHMEPNILIVDEVLSVGDDEFQRKSLKKMEEITKKEGRTILFVSHNMNAIRRLCNRCLLLKEGKLIMIGSPTEVTKKYVYSFASTKYRITELSYYEKKEISLRKVTLKSSNISYEDPITIRLEYEVKTSIANCIVWLGLENEEGVMVLSTADTDLQPDLLKERQKGYYRQDVLVPEKLLNMGEYTIIAGIVQQLPFKVFERTESIKFTIVDTGTSPCSVSRDKNRRGVIQPFIKWNNIRA